jgi:hypothetical protein
LRKKWVPLFENEQFLLVRDFFCCAARFAPECEHPAFIGLSCGVNETKRQKSAAIKLAAIFKQSHHADCNPPLMWAGERNRRVRNLS